MFNKKTLGQYFVSVLMFQNLHTSQPLHLVLYVYIIPHHLVYVNNNLHNIYDIVYFNENIV